MTDKRDRKEQTRILKAVGGQSRKTRKDGLRSFHTEIRVPILEQLDGQPPDLAGVFGKVSEASN